MRRIVVKGWRRFGFIVAAVIVEWQVLVKTGFWGGIIRHSCVSSGHDPLRFHRFLTETAPRPKHSSKTH